MVGCGAHIFVHVGIHGALLMPLCPGARLGVESGAHIELLFVLECFLNLCTSLKTTIFHQLGHFDRYFTLGGLTISELSPKVYR